MRYQYYLIDADETLFDFPKAQLIAVEKALGLAGWSTAQSEIDRFKKINQMLWSLREKGEITQEQLILRRFSDLTNGKARIPDEQIATSYLEFLSQGDYLYDGALDVVKDLRSRGNRVAIVTNGVALTQHGRIKASGMDVLLDALIISEEVQSIKPNPAMIQCALDQMGCTDRTEAIMIGDGASTDIECAHNAGIDSCWYNPLGKRYPLERKPTYEIQSLQQILSL